MNRKLRADQSRDQLTKYVVGAKANPPKNPRSPSKKGKLRKVGRIGYLVTSNDMNYNKHVGHSNEPHRLFQGDENVAFHRIAKHPVADKGNREVAQRHHNVSNNHSPPHRNLGRLLRRRRDSSLNLQHNIVTCIRECHTPQNGVEVGEVSEDKMDRGEDHNEIGEFDLFAVLADDVMELLEGLSSSNHVHNIHSNLNNELLGDDDPEAEFLAKGVLPQLVISVEAFAFNHFVHLNHLPESV
nr:hypothetical protein C2845_PM13G01850 [Ipomoea batatas]